MRLKGTRYQEFADDEEEKLADFDEPGEDGSRDGAPEDPRLSYLRKIGCPEKAEILYPVKIEIPLRGEPVTIELPGKCRPEDALAYLKIKGYLRENRKYMFADWPKADPVIGSRYQRESACVCELPERVYHVMDLGLDRRTVCLYGCPNIKELTNTVPEKKVEVIDYAR